MRVGFISGGQSCAAVTPFGFFVDGAIRDCSQRSNHVSVDTHSRRGEGGSRRFLHERHKFVRKTRQRAGDADTADVEAASDAPHPAALRDIAIDDGAPAADLYQASRFAVLMREVGLFVVPSAIASFVNRFAE